MTLITSIWRKYLNPVKVGVFINFILVFWYCLFSFLFFILTAFGWRIHNLPLNYFLLTFYSFLASFCFHTGLVNWGKTEGKINFTVAYLGCFILLGYLVNFFGMLILFPAVIAFTFLLSVMGKYLFSWIKKFKSPYWAGALFLAHCLLLLPLFNFMVDRSFFGQFDAFSFVRGLRLDLRESPVYEINKDRYRGPILKDDEDYEPLLLFLGDSSTFGVYYKNKYNYPSQAIKLIRKKGYPNANALNAGVPGMNIREIARRYEKYKHLKPDYVFIMAGLHYMDSFKKPINYPPYDFGDGFNFARGIASFWVIAVRSFYEHKKRPKACLKFFRKSTERLIRKVKEDGAHPVIIEYPSSRIDTLLKEEMDGLAEQNVVTYLSTFKDLKAIDGITFDKVHPNKRGYKKIGEIVSDFVLNDMKKKR